jgi:chaperone required for assembly of F1-ATPase
LRAHLATLDDFTLAAVNTLASLAASLTIALAALDDGADAQALWTLANLEEDWQAELWGEDYEAKELRERRSAEFAQALRFAALARSAG